MLYLILVMTFTLLAGSAWVLLGWRNTRALAPVVFEKRKEQGDLNRNVPLEAFSEAYIRSEGPRFATYLVSAGAATALAFPVVVFVFAQLWLEIWNLIGGPDWAEQGSFVYLTMMVFLYIGFFFIVAWVTMQRFHIKAPPTLRAEIRRLNGEFG